jgi:hypothetical protein
MFARNTVCLLAPALLQAWSQLGFPTGKVD